MFKYKKSNYKKFDNGLELIPVMKNKGFTLIELLVVVAIIGVLSAVGVVAYNGYTSSAKKTVTEQNHKMMVKQFTILVTEYDLTALTLAALVYPL